MATQTARCYVAIGANLGDPTATIRAAISALSEIPDVKLVRASALYRTAPIGLKHQPDFINAVVAIELNSGVSSAPTDKKANASTLMQALFRIEEKFGRQREPSGARNLARTLDLDMLLYADEISDDPNLTLPHPRMHERAFVLVPLFEIAPDLVIPNRGNVRELLAQCADQRIERLSK